MRMILEPLHVGISVYHMEESIAWYERNLGFRLLRDDGFLPPLNARICFLEKDGFQIELFEYAQPIPLPEERRSPNSDLQTVGTKHIAFRVADMTAVRETMLANGVNIVMETTMGTQSVMFIHDCNGVLLELIQP